ncbi:MAG: CcmD family protein [Pedobacter sp.]|nr:MAG: CcmD family protein [Pedobacter sp.]
MKKLLCLFLLLTSFLFSTNLMAQSVDSVMRSNGRIYVVITVLVIILLGVFLYLVRLDNKITRLEKEQSK